MSGQYECCRATLQAVAQAVDERLRRGAEDAQAGFNSRPPQLRPYTDQDRRYLEGLLRGFDLARATIAQVSAEWGGHREWEEVDAPDTPF